jgi:hypothetical protein
VATIIQLAIFFSGLSEANTAVLVSWHSEQFRLKAAAMNPVVPMN